ncbi:MAG: gliding motility-associated C-terminal domain-containing protein [Robiginitalea sp.]|nr:gliding motility-associated C-terminal domain-containing protein [Robiginitalea sp.]
MLLNPGLAIWGQEGIQNHGTMRLHNEGALGFHLDFSNRGPFVNSSGLVGFYADESPLKVTGSQIPELYDIEVSVPEGLFLEVPILINNNANFIQGDVQTGRNPNSATLQFNFDSFYTGERDASKVDGYASLFNRQEFTFPVGDSRRLRTLRLESMAINARAVCAYFPENPGQPLSLPDPFPIPPTGNPGIVVSDKEFWVLESDLPSRVTLGWDARSEVGRLSDALEGLRVVGWSKAEQQWVDLGNTDYQGTTDAGTVQSDYFVPSDYAVLTFGGAGLPENGYEILTLENYYLSPNGDGINEYLVIEAVSESPNNAIQIYNRHGLLVYEEENYQNDFNGISNSNLAINKEKGLEKGIYFYLISFHDLGQQHQGYFYLTD